MQTETHPCGGYDDAVGLSWLMRDLGGERFFGHTGQTVGYLSEILIRRERDFALVALTNTVSDAGFRRDLRERVLGAALGLEVRAPAPMRDPPRDLAEYEGTWRSPFELQTLRAAGPPGVLVLEPRAHPPRARHLDAAGAAALALGLLRAATAWWRSSPRRCADTRAEFVRGADGRIAWFRCGGEDRAAGGRGAL